MRKVSALIILMILLLLFSCSKEEFSVSSLSLRSDSLITIADGKTTRDETLTLSASFSDDEAVYTFRVVSPDEDLVWEGTMDGSGVREAGLELTPGASFPEGSYSVIFYSDKGTVYSGSAEYSGSRNEYPHYGPEGLTMSAETEERDVSGILVGRGRREKGYVPSPYASSSIIRAKDRQGNTMEIHDDLSLFSLPLSADPSQTAL